MCAGKRPLPVFSHQVSIRTAVTLSSYLPCYS
jgi:hypothetical protein